MKPVWVGIIFFIVYGMFSIKSQAAEVVLIACPAVSGVECQ